MKTGTQIQENIKTNISEIINLFLKVRKQTNDICHPLLIEDYTIQPIIDVSPPKWHLAHTTWFFENFVLIPSKKNYRAFNPGYNYLFNSYYESVGERILRANRGYLSRPTIEDIYNYRMYVNENLLDFLNSNGLITTKILKIIELGINHEQQHQELLLMDIKYILGTNPLFPAFLNSENTNEHPPEKPIENYLDMAEGIYEIGYSGNEFSYDNEKEKHKVYLNSFRYLDRLITNQEYLEFIEAKGYEDFSFWLQEGWEWIKLNNITSPLYWHYSQKQWHYYTLRGLKPLGYHDPVTHVSYYEADAFAKWKNKRLLTEFEWEVVAKELYKVIPENANFLEEGHYAPVPRKNYSTQLFGDVWEWTSSAYLPYPGFKIAQGALGEYNGKFMINQMILRGGSCATPKNHIRFSYRNFFHPDKRWQFSGIRLAENLK
ncbi:MAG: ergothioneine biosynthesis protein EgtB [Bacteroidetes bacterium]|nr:ergothioneine biosynthesis protein EgtB [Bacteroidota bacterium]HET6245001.1 ergothioneine biosynthesis protein EgtB [Bacteroidia bacterium]